jgi:AraC family transcriptional regulator of adaptative response / methylphosphotriester-DNA alkyltransferase methyltransferase
MDVEQASPTELHWTAISTNDAGYDGRFLYGVKTTRIFCRPSCKSKLPLRENVVVFRQASEALEQQFRPCKRCKPDGLSLPSEDWIQWIAVWIQEHYAEPVTLQKLADIAHGSPYHLQRQFKRLKGLSPAEYVQEVRLAAAKHKLLTTAQSAAEIGRTVGFASVPYFNALFKKMVGDTPADYRRKHARQQEAGGRSEHENNNRTND